MTASAAVRRAWPAVALLAASTAARAGLVAVPEHFRACNDDRDCVAVQEGCCPCGASGKRTAINAGRVPEYRRLLESACAAAGVCARTRGRDFSCEASVRPSCEAGRCCLLEDLPVGESARKDLLEEYKKGAAWLEGLRGSAVEIRRLDDRLAEPGLGAKEKRGLKRARGKLLGELDASAKANAWNYEAQIYLAQVFLSVGENKRALLAASMAADMAPRDHRSFTLRGMARHKLGDEKAAARDAREALKLRPDDKAAQDLLRLAELKPFD
ncbi:MAG: hypothetical protein HY927_09085 [Elusimicrobia bacterium]|nr:hypothetical protein [Elusimicrobiota bacterium]